MDESAFFQAALADPTDDTLFLVYSDWLEDKGDDASTTKATFLRLTVRLRALPMEAAPDARRRLQEIAARLDPEWLAVVSRLEIENCGAVRDRTDPRISWVFAYQCDRSWDRMEPTADTTVRFCTSCRESVYYCDTIVTARKHAEAGHCIAVDLGIIRRKNDVIPNMPVPGFPSEQWLAQEAERLRVDEVSAEREARKQQQNTQDK
jgi:uncharacterized protein (TIGR02996 family)